jgi:hypothetical protein
LISLGQPIFMTSPCGQIVETHLGDKLIRNEVNCLAFGFLACLVFA